MPSLKLFGRKWRIGSDDFVFPSSFEAIIRAGWFVVAVFTNKKH